MASDIVDVGLLTSDDLKRLGDSCDRAYPVTNDDVFADLMAKLDQIAPVNGRVEHRGAGSERD